MSSILRRLIALIVVVLLQSFLFNNLTMGLSLMPLVYIIFIILLPLNTPQFEMILWGVVLGVVMDLSMGLVAVNTIATLAVSYWREYIVAATLSKKNAILTSGMPLLWRVKSSRLAYYAVVMTTLHSLIFYIFESMNPLAWSVLWWRYLLSLGVTLIFIYLLVVFTSIVITRKREG